MVHRERALLRLILTFWPMDIELSLAELLIVGDTHADSGWLRSVVLPTAADLGVEALVVVGDFGYWSTAEEFIKIAREGQSTHGVSVLFLDGNHEDHALLARDVASTGADLSAGRAPVWLGGGLFYLPRGARIGVGGLSVSCFGGAASIDRDRHTPGVDWFEEEVLSDLDLSFAQPSDVLLSHDAPSGWDIPNLPVRWAMSQSWLNELGRCDQHRGRLREGYEVVAPTTVVHGHYHSDYQTTTQEAWGSVLVTGLNAAGYGGWGAKLSCGPEGAVVDRDIVALAASV
jgi:hypothetical protein